MEFWSGVGTCDFGWPVTSNGGQYGMSFKRGHVCTLPPGHELPHVCEGCGYDVQEVPHLRKAGYA